MRSFMFLFLLTGLLLSGCTAGAAPESEAKSPPSEQSRLLHVTGKIVFIPLEGGFFGILASDGQKFDPIGLPEEFRRDGLPVRAVLRPAQEVVSFRMWGTIVEIVAIEKDHGTAR